MKAKLFTIKDNTTHRAAMKGCWTFVNQEIQSGALDVTVARASKTRRQEAMYHSMIGDIFKQVVFKDEHGSAIKADREWIKAILIDDFAQEMLLAGTPISKPGRITISLDKQRMIQIRPSSAQFLVKEASAFIEYLFAFGAQESVEWSDPETQSMYRDYWERTA